MYDERIEKELHQIGHQSFMIASILAITGTIISLILNNLVITQICLVISFFVSGIYYTVKVARKGILLKKRNYYNKKFVLFLDFVCLGILWFVLGYLLGQYSLPLTFKEFFTQFISYTMATLGFYLFMYMYRKYSQKKADEEIN
ncbi:DUF6773 family protein [Bacillus mycoides]|uniref:DUF6773 family protein n=1 Tax=Bacillus mycoides TaxID=1405 RepID=UPI002E00EC3C|nr:hypothetical protein [Bacillus mycoides]MEC5265109.1 hypothetical protein [Bacillus mycoides]